MPDAPLTVANLLHHGSRVYSDSEVITAAGAGTRRTMFAEVADRVDRLAGALFRLGVGRGDRVGTLRWNDQVHLEAYLAVPSMGAVLHTINVRLGEEQLAHVINDGGDRVLLVDAALLPAVEAVADRLPHVTHLLVTGEADPVARSGLACLDYEALLDGSPAGYRWPVLDEREAAVMCHTSGTTGDPRGVVYSHRSTWLHSLSLAAAYAYGLTDHDRVLVVVPMFHANAWGLPYTGWWCGSDLLLPHRDLSAATLVRLISEHRPTVSSGVPTVWNALLHHPDRPEPDLSSLRLVTVGGSAAPRALLDGFLDRFGIKLVQGWGMTETSPLAALATPPRGSDPADDAAWRATSGRVVPGVELRLVDNDTDQELPWDGVATGEIEVRGPWVTTSYLHDPAADKFHDGWLRTGDIGTVDPHGFLQITDRTKDIIKSGGEWISSMALQDALASHPDVVEAAVVGVADDRWGERPAAVVALRAGSQTSTAELREHMANRVERWCVPDHWLLVPEVPKTSVGKYDKRRLRSELAASGRAAPGAPASGRSSGVSPDGAGPRSQRSGNR